MGIGSSRIGKAFCVALSTAALLLPASTRELNTGIWKVMREGGFAGPFDDKEDRLRLIGNMDVGKWHYRFMDYEYLESKRHMVPGGVQHGGSMLVVFERTSKGLVYLGRYETWGGHPKIEGRALVFPYKDPLGMHVDRTVTFDENGPPSQIFLDGMVFPLQKRLVGLSTGK
jgi:hypothetical protein